MEHITLYTIEDLQRFFVYNPEGVGFYEIPEGVHVCFASALQMRRGLGLTIHGTLEVQGAFFTNGSIWVGGALAVDGSLAIRGENIFSGKVTVKGDLRVSSEPDFSNLFVEKYIYIGGVKHESPNSRDKKALQLRRSRERLTRKELCRQLEELETKTEAEITKLKAEITKLTNELELEREFGYLTKEL